MSNLATPIDRLSVFPALGTVEVFNVLFSWFRLSAEPPSGSRYYVPSGPADGFALEGGRVYAFSCVLDCLRIRWGTTETFRAGEILEIELGTGAAPASTKTTPGPTPAVLVYSGDIIIPPFGAGPESTTLTWSPLHWWRSDQWDGVNAMPEGRMLTVPRRARLLSYAKTASRAYTLWWGTPHTLVSSLAEIVPLERIESEARPGAYHRASSCLECVPGSIAVGGSITSGAQLRVFVELWLEL